MKLQSSENKYLNDQIKKIKFKIDDNLKNQMLID